MALLYRVMSPKDANGMANRSSLICPEKLGSLWYMYVSTWKSQKKNPKTLYGIYGNWLIASIFNHSIAALIFISAE